MTDLTGFSRAGETFSFDTVGDTLKGTITQIRDPHERTNKFTGDPEVVMAITIQQDDGEEYSVWPRMSPYSSMGGAISDAAKDGDGSISEGGTLAIQFCEEMDTGKPHKAKIYVAEYAAPVKSTRPISDPEPGTRRPLLSDPDEAF